MKQKTRVLVVDDNPVHIELLVLLLRKGGMVVESVETAEQGLEWLQNTTFDVVLCDIGLTGMSGLQFAREVRRLPDYRRLPLAAMSSSALTEDTAAALAAGFDVFLGKPFDAAFADRVRELVKSTQGGRQV